jgi:hypothetical protein
MSEPIHKGTIPIIAADTTHQFAAHWRVRPERVMLSDGSFVNTGFVAVDKGKFNLYDLCQATTPPKQIVLVEMLYADAGDMAQVHPMTKLVPIDNDRSTTTRHFTTKLEGLKWGIQFDIDLKTGWSTLRTDIESPILGVRFKLQ